MCKPDNIKIFLNIESNKPYYGKLMLRYIDEIEIGYRGEIINKPIISLAVNVAKIVDFYLNEIESIEILK